MVEIEREREGGRGKDVTWDDIDVDEFFVHSLWRVLPSLKVLYPSINKSATPLLPPPFLNFFLNFFFPQFMMYSRCLKG